MMEQHVDFWRENMLIGMDFYLFNWVTLYVDEYPTDMCLYYTTFDILYSYMVLTSEQVSITML